MEAVIAFKLQKIQLRYAGERFIPTALQRA